MSAPRDPFVLGVPKQELKRNRAAALKFNLDPKPHAPPSPGSDPEEVPLPVQEQLLDALWLEADRLKRGA